MPARKATVRLPNAKNTGKSTTGKYLDDHPELQTGYWKNQVMTYDSAVAIERNEIDVFAVMAFDKLKASKEDLDATGQCEEMGPLFDNCITNFNFNTWSLILM